MDFSSMSSVLKDMEKLQSSLLSGLPPEVAEKLKKQLEEPELPQDPEQQKHSLKKIQKELQANLSRMQRKLKAGKAETEDESSSSESEDSDNEVSDEVGKLFTAVAIGNLVTCDHLIQSGVDVNSRGPIKATALHAAAQEDKLDIANLLLSRGAKVNAVDKDGDTPLMIAVMKKRRGIIRLLLERGTDLKIKNKRGLTAADLAFATNHLDILELLENKENGLQFDANVHRETVLSLVTKGSVKMIEYWLNKFPQRVAIKPVDLQYKDGRTIAFAAALNGSMELIELVDKRGGNLDLPDDSNSSPLFCAAQNGHESIAQLLLNRGCNVNRVRDTGTTPLFSAIARSHVPIAKMLVEAEANVNIKDKKGVCPLAWCITMGSQEIFEYLLNEKNADPRVVDNDGHDLVLLAASFKRLKMLKELHKHGLPLDEVNPKDGETALLTACQASSAEIVKYLIKHGCDVNRVNKKGVTPALRAAATKDLETVKLLAQNGAKLDVPNRLGDTAILVAAQKKANSLVKFLHDKNCDLSDTDDNGHTLASHAAATDNMDLLNFLATHSAPLDVPNNKGITPLMFAAMRPANLKILSKLLELKCNYKTKSAKGNTALSIAAKHGSVDVLQHLISVGGDLLNITNSGKTVLMQASKSRQLDVLKIINESEKKPDVNATDNSGRTAVHFAALSGHLDVLEFLVGEMKAETNVWDNQHFTPFMLAIAKGHKSVAEKLLDLGADINLRNRDGESTAHIAVRGGHLDILRYLSLKKCYMDQEDNQGMTPLLLACKHKKLEMLNFLISKGCSIESVTKDGHQAIHEACGSGRFPVAMRIINLGAPVDAVDCSGVIALMLAAQRGAEKTAKALIDRKKDLIGIRDASGKTALDFAVQGGRVKLVKLLIEAGCDVNNLMVDGRTSLMLALENCKDKSEEIVHLLIEHGANVEAVSPDGLNTAHLACKFNKLTSLKLLMEKGVPLDAITKDGDSCLTLAMPKGCVEMIDLLIETGLDKRQTNSQSHSAISLACRRGTEEILSKMLPISDEDMAGSYAEGNSLLHFACESGSEKLVDNFLSERHISPDKTNQQLETPLHVACNKDNQEVVIQLLNFNADVNAMNGNGETPIFNALTKGSEEICKLLIDKGADLNVVNKDGVSFLAKAFHQGNCSIIRMLQSTPAQGPLKLFPEQLPENFDVFRVNVKSGNVKNLKSLLTEGLPATRCEGDTPVLHLAIMSNQDAILDSILQKRRDLRAKDIDGVTPLMTALKTGRIDIAEKILEQCPESKDDVNNDGDTVLHVAVKCGKATTLQWLLSKFDFPKDIKNKADRTALHSAALKGNETMYKLLLDKGWSSNLVAKNESSRLTASHFAVMSGNMHFVRSLHDSGSLVLRAPQSKRPSVLQLLAEYGQSNTLQWLCAVTGENFEDASFLAVRNSGLIGRNESLAQWLIDKGVDMQRKDDVCGKAAVSSAVVGGNFHLCRLLVEQPDSDVCVKCKDGVSLVQYAVFAGHEPMLRFLIKKGAPIEEIDERGDTPLLEAANLRKPKMLKILHGEFGCIINRNNKLQRNAAHLAAIAGGVEILDYLKKHLSQASFDACDLHQDTPLMLAVLYSQPDAVKFLLDNFQLDIDNQNDTGSTALHWAALSADKTLTRLLLTKDPKVNIGDQDDATPLMLAVQAKSVDCVQLLLDKEASAASVNKHGDSALALMLHSDVEAIREIGHTLQVELVVDDQTRPISSVVLGHRTRKSLHYRDHFPENEPTDEQQQQSDDELEDEVDERDQEPAENAVEEPQGASASAAGVQRAPSVVSRRTAASNASRTTRTSFAQSERPQERATMPRVTSVQTAQHGRFTTALEISRPDVQWRNRMRDSLSELAILRSLQYDDQDPDAASVCRVRDSSLRLEVSFDLHGEPLQVHLNAIRDRDPNYRYLGDGDGQTAARSILSGLKYLHSKGVTHGSLRLKHVRITDGRLDRLKLTNFGKLARLVRQSRQQEQGTSCRRKPWTAPEELRRGAEEMVMVIRDGTREADMWAFGCTLHEVLIGLPPELMMRAEDLTNSDYLIGTYARAQHLNDSVRRTHLSENRIFPLQLQTAFRQVYKELPGERRTASELLTDLQP